MYKIYEEGDEVLTDFLIESSGELFVVLPPEEQEAEAVSPPFYYPKKSIKNIYQFFSYKFVKEALYIPYAPDCPLHGQHGVAFYKQPYYDILYSQDFEAYRFDKNLQLPDLSGWQVSEPGGSFYLPDERLVSVVLSENDIQREPGERRYTRIFDQNQSLMSPIITYQWVNAGVSEGEVQAGISGFPPDSCITQHPHQIGEVFRKDYIYVLGHYMNFNIFSEMGYLVNELALLVLVPFLYLESFCPVRRREE